MLLKAGTHPRIVQERLGHSSIATTLDIYSHTVPGLQEAAAEKFDRIFEAGKKQKSKGNVSKMLAKNEDLASMPYRSRTCNLLIKSQVLIIDSC